jgi:hypothetical protein
MGTLKEAIKEAFGAKEIAEVIEFCSLIEFILICFLIDN